MIRWHAGEILVREGAHCHIITSAVCRQMLATGVDTFSPVRTWTPEGLDEEPHIRCHFFGIDSKKGERVISAIFGQASNLLLCCEGDSRTCSLTDPCSLSQSLNSIFGPIGHPRDRVSNDIQFFCEREH